MRKVTWLLVVIVLLGISLTVGPDAWAGPGQSRIRQTVPTRTPTPGPTATPQDPTAEPPPGPTPTPGEATPDPPDSTPAPDATDTPPGPTPTIAEETEPTETPEAGVEEPGTVTPTGETEDRGTAEPQETPEGDSATAVPTAEAPEETEREEISLTASPGEEEGETTAPRRSVSPLLVGGMGLVVAGLIVLVVWGRRA